MKTALVTGGSGFIGTSLVEYLSKRAFQVYVFDRHCTNHSRMHRQGSILDFESIYDALQDVDVVYHLAGLLGTTELLRQSVEAIDVNIKGTVHVLEACRQAGVKQLFYPTKPNEWLNTYSVTKKAGEEFAQMYKDIYGLDVRILRWLNVYGPGQKLHPIRKAVPVMIFQALHNLPIEIYGKGTQPVDLIYSDDLARITVEYMEASAVEPRVRDTGCTVRMTVNELAELIKRLTSSWSAIAHLPMRPGEDADKPVSLLKTDTAAHLLGCNGMTTKVEEGLTKTIEYYTHLPKDIVNTIFERYARHGVRS